MQHADFIRSLTFSRRERCTRRSHCGRAPVRSGRAHVPGLSERAGPKSPEPLGDVRSGRYRALPLHTKGGREERETDLDPGPGGQDRSGGQQGRARRSPRVPLESCHRSRATWLFARERLVGHLQSLCPRLCTRCRLSVYGLARAETPAGADDSHCSRSDSIRCTARPGQPGLANQPDAKIACMRTKWLGEQPVLCHLGPCAHQILESNGKPTCPTQRSQGLSGHFGQAVACQCDRWCGVRSCSCNHGSSNSRQAGYPVGRCLDARPSQSPRGVAHSELGMGKRYRRGFIPSPRNSGSCP